MESQDDKMRRSGRYKLRIIMKKQMRLIEGEEI